MAPRVVEAAVAALAPFDQRSVLVGRVWRHLRADIGDDGEVSSEDLENYETEAELALYREYRDVVGLFRYVVETERRFYLCNKVDLQVRSAGADIYFEVSMADAWVWDVYRSARLVRSVRVVTFKDVNVEELDHDDAMPDIRQLRGGR